jgi:hypothetical protein
VLTNGGWKRAQAAYPDKQVTVLEDRVYDLVSMDVHETEAQALSLTTAHSYPLESGIVAHNVLPK